jgi:hypothetical protein
LEQEGFGIPYELLWRDLEACEAGRRICWKEFRALGRAGEEIKEPTNEIKCFIGSKEVRGIQELLEIKIGISCDDDEI